MQEVTTSAATSSIDRSLVGQRARTLHIIDQIRMRGWRHRSLLPVHLQLLKGVDELLHRFFHELQVVQARELTFFDPSIDSKETSLV